MAMADRSRFGTKPVSNPYKRMLVLHSVYTKIWGYPRKLLLETLEVSVCIKL